MVHVPAAQLHLTHCTLTPLFPLHVPLLSASSVVVLQLILSADPYIPQTACDRLLVTMCAREVHSPGTVAMCDALLPLHSSATSVPRPAAITKASAVRATSGHTAITPASSDALPPLLAVFVPTQEHQPDTANLVRLLVAHQPAGTEGR